jgi:type VI secretion system VasD/TssJ family lipoprotein
MLRFYELTEADKFSKLSFQALADEAAKQLGDNLISQAKHVVLRNKIQSYKIRFDDKAKYFGVVGSFRKLDENGTWRFVKNLEVGKRNELELLINRHSIKEDD